MAAFKLYRSFRAAVLIVRVPRATLRGYRRSALPWAVLFNAFSVKTVAAIATLTQPARGPMADPETVRQLALALPDTSERPCYGTPGFYVKKTLFARLLEDGDSVVLKIDLSDRSRRMK